MVQSSEAGISNRRSEHETYKRATKIQNQLQLGNRPKENGNIAATNERVVRNVNYYKCKPNEDHMEWWESTPACIGEAAEV